VQLKVAVEEEVGAVEEEGVLVVFLCRTPMWFLTAELIH
jgi:hypothetical protein